MNVAIFEGPASARMAGWRHYQIRLANGTVRSCMARPLDASKMVKELRARFFAAGTWEESLEAGSQPALFPLPRREILELLSSRGPLARPRGEFDTEPLFSGSMRPEPMGCVV